MMTPRRLQNKTEGPAGSSSVPSITRYTLATLASHCPHPSRRLPDLIVHSSCRFLCLSPALSACLFPSSEGPCQAACCRVTAGQHLRAGGTQQAR